MRKYTPGIELIKSGWGYLLKISGTGFNLIRLTKLAFINADWRDFQHTPAVNEIPEDALLIDDYLHLLHKTGWLRTHIIQAPLSSERFEAGVVAAMQKKKILGVTSRYVIIVKQF